MKKLKVDYFTELIFSSKVQLQIKQCSISVFLYYIDIYSFT